MPRVPIQHVTIEFDLDPAEFSRFKPESERHFLERVNDYDPEYLLEYAVRGSVVVTTTPKGPKPDASRHAGSL
jgi:hypothetical protein